MSGNIYIYNKRGFCKFGNECRNRHVNEICGNSKCDKLSCELRHPLLCRFYMINGVCKFGSDCAYLHKEREEKVRIEQLECKVAATESKI